MPSMGGWEWVIIVVVAVLLFGGARLAQVGKGAGRAIREFKSELKSAEVESGRSGSAGTAETDDNLPGTVKGDKA